MKSPHLPQLEKDRPQQQRPSTAKNIFKKFKNLKKKSSPETCLVLQFGLSGACVGCLPRKSGASVGQPPP